jgi:hypothetical protein
MHTRGTSRWWVKMLLLSVTTTAVGLSACDSSAPPPPKLAPPSTSPATAESIVGRKVKPKDNDDPLSPREKMARRTGH